MTARSILAFGLNDSRLILRDSFLRDREWDQEGDGQ
mgnify:CR=1 FL=1